MPVPQAGGKIGSLLSQLLPISPDELMKMQDAAYLFDEKAIDLVRTTMQEAEKKK
jgi:hypothetical protein